MKYPNFVAEYKASGYCVESLANAANVTIELMQDILEDKEDMTAEEAIKLYYHLGGLYGNDHYSFNYLYAPKEGTFDPNKKRFQMYEFKKLMEEAVSCLNCEFFRKEFAFIQEVFNILKRGKVIKYAYYRQAVQSLRMIVADKKNTINRRGRREQRAI